MEDLPGEQGTFFRGVLTSGMAYRKGREVNAKRIEAAKATAGVEEEINTWSGWKKLGYEVIHGSKALFGADLIWGSRGDGAIYKARFFGRSQVQELATA